MLHNVHKSTVTGMDDQEISFKEQKYKCKLVPHFAPKLSVSVGCDGIQALVSPVVSSELLTNVKKENK